MGMQESIRARWHVWQDEFLQHQALASRSQSMSSAVSKFIMISQGSLLLGIGVFLTLAGIIPAASAGAIVIAKILGARAMAPVMTLISSLKQIEAVRDALERLDAFLEKVPPQETHMSLPAPQGALSVEHVTLRPPGSKQSVLHDINFVLKAGCTLAVVGPSGSGKSSLARVILGLWPPLAGTVRLDGVNVASWNKAELGPYLGYLPQDVELFDGTLAENVARFGEIDPHKLADAISLAGLDAFVEQLPHGLKTDIGVGGVTLSGGQRQRVGLARAVYGTPQLVILDEPNSSLDEAGDAALSNALQELKLRGSTVVVITHRTGLLAVADNMLVLADGHLRLYGPRDQVLLKLRKDTRGTAGRSKTSSIT
jgi:ATP-binding cassette subfamily C exporter for protease/lipase